VPLNGRKNNTDCFESTNRSRTEALNMSSSDADDDEGMPALVSGSESSNFGSSSSTSGDSESSSESSDDSDTREDFRPTPKQSNYNEKKKTTSKGRFQKGFLNSKKNKKSNVNIHKANSDEFSGMPALESVSSESESSSESSESDDSDTSDDFRSTPKQSNNNANKKKTAKGSFQKGFLNSKKNKNSNTNNHKVNTKKRSSKDVRSDTNDIDARKSNCSAHDNNNNSNDIKKKPRQIKKEQKILNYIKKQKNLLEKELNELKKYEKLENYTGKVRSAFENNKYIVCTNITVAMNLFQFALKQLNEINVNQNEILKSVNQDKLDYSDVGIIYGYRFREVTDKGKICYSGSRQFYETIQIMPLTDPVLDCRQHLTQRLKQKAPDVCNEVCARATSNIIAFCSPYKYMKSTLFLGNPNFFNEMLNNVTLNKNIFFTFFADRLSDSLPDQYADHDGSQEPLWDIISKYYEAHVNHGQYGVDFPVWNPEFGKRLFSQLKQFLSKDLDVTGIEYRRHMVESLIHDQSADYILLEGIKLLRAAPKFCNILEAPFLSKQRCHELLQVMLQILKEDSLLNHYFYEVETCPVFTLIELNLNGDKVEYLKLVEMFIIEFGFDPLVFSQLKPSGKTTNAFRLVLDMYFKDELKQKTVRKYLEYFMLDLKKSYNTYDKVTDGKSVKQYFESKYEQINKHRKKKGDWKRMIAEVQKERKKRKQKAKRRQRKKGNNDNGNFDEGVNNYVKAPARTPKPLKKKMKNTNAENKVKLSNAELLHAYIVNFVNDFTEDTDWVNNLDNRHVYSNIDKELLRQPSHVVQTTTDKISCLPSSRGVSPGAQKVLVPDKENPIHPNNRKTPTVATEVADRALDNTNFDPASFDSEKHEWEVVFCPKVKDFFKKQRKKNFHTCVRMMNCISELATGNRWRNNERLKKGVTHSIKDKLQLNLFEAKPSQSERILWEITPETSKRHGDTRDVIRIWDIVLDHDNLSSAIKQVRKAHKLGKESRKKWTWKVKRKQFISDDKKTTYPAIYVRHGENEGDENIDTSELTEQYFFIEPNTAKFNPIRHYFINSSAATALLYFEEDDDFELESGGNEQETRIITRGLNPDPRKRREKESSILLLGRSGTGKTTCLIYRLFNEFKLFWERRKQNEEKRELLREARQAEINLRNAKRENHEDENLDKDEDGDDIAQDEFDEFDGEDFGAIFITKSQVLRSECLKQFKKLRAGLSISEKILTENEEDRVVPADAHPLRLYDLPASFYREDPERENLGTQIQMGTFPMFLTADAYWRMLDNTLPGKRVKYFQHRPVPLDELRTVGDIVNINQDNPLDGLEELPLDEMNLSSDSEYTDSEDDEAKESVDAARALSNIKYIEVTFEIFVQKFWGKIKNVKSFKENKYNAAVVWGEIRSHIKGSIHTYTHEVPLTRSEYTVTEVGKKQSNLSEAERHDIYDMYEKYESMRKQAVQDVGETTISWYYDIMDALQEIIPRLKQFKASSLDEQNKIVPIFTSYVDEIQDFTQVETAIIINFCKDPNRLVLAGDTAQNICSGVSFRFEDIKSIFYNLNEGLIKEKEVQADAIEDAEKPGVAFIKNWKTKTKSINVPSEKDGTFCHLNLNFRSHDGVLLLAASVVELLYEYFPVSIDKLDPDNGIKDGPKPILFKSCNGHDLLMMLLGSRDTSSKVPFGASQAILVRSKDAIKSLPKELIVHPVILTINESKGLEFDGILLYNFFKNSKATEKTWRCVAKYMDRHKHKNMQTVEGEMSPEEFQTYCNGMKRKLRGRAKDFEETADRILESELKLLYTAITRAKSNVWIFDEDDNKSIPMFEYFERRKLVEIVQSIEDIQSNSGSIAQSATNGANEWIKQALVFEKSGRFKQGYEERKRFYKLAKGCYDKAVEQNAIAIKNVDLSKSMNIEENNEDIINEGMIHLNFDKNSSLDYQNGYKEHLQKQIKYCEEQIIKCNFEVLLANSQLIKSTEPKKYVECLLEAAKAAAVAFKMTRLKTPYGKYLLSIYYNLAKHVETKNGRKKAQKYYEIIGNLSYAFNELKNAKSFFEKAGDKSSAAKIEKYLKGSTNNDSDNSDNSDNESKLLTETAEMNSSHFFVKIMDDERIKALNNRRNNRKRRNKRTVKAGEGKQNQPTKKNAKRPALNVEVNY
jgi:hypothetical protein